MKPAVFPARRVALRVPEPVFSGWLGALPRLRLPPGLEPRGASLPSAPGPVPPAAPLAVLSVFDDADVSVTVRVREAGVERVMGIAARRELVAILGRSVPAQRTADRTADRTDDRGAERGAHDGRPAGAVTLVLTSAAEAVPLLVARLPALPSPGRPTTHVAITVHGPRDAAPGHQERWIGTGDGWRRVTPDTAGALRWTGPYATSSFTRRVGFLVSRALLAGEAGR